MGKGHVGDKVRPLLNVMLNRVTFAVVVGTVVFSLAPDEGKLALSKSTLEEVAWQLLES